MEKHEYIILDDFCKYYSIEATFIRTLGASGIIELEERNEVYYIDCDQIPLLEKYINMYYNMDINIEGLETIHHLLATIESLQRELRQLKDYHI